LRIGRAIQSVLGQTRSVDEIIVVDDGSTDETLAVASGFGEKVLCVRQDNLGAAAARNLGIRHARHEWIAFLDADDEWQSGHIERACQVLQRHPDLVWFSAAIERRDEEGRFLGRFGAEAAFVHDDVIEDYFGAEAKERFSFIQGMLVKKRVFDEVGGFNEEIRQYGEDLDMCFRIALRFPRVGYSPSVGIIYRIRRGSLTHAGDPGLERFLRRIEITRASSASVPPENARRSEILIQAWVASAVRSAVRNQDAKILKEVQRTYPQLLTWKWRVVVRLFQYRAAMRAVAFALWIRTRWRRGRG
jgi:glycosyltransferase involved in cell wall biosynthesis